MDRVSDSTGVAVIGAGYWGRKLIQEYLSAEMRGGVQLRKVCDSSVPSLGALLISKGTDKLTPNLLTQNFNDVLADDKVAAVHIAIPNQFHYEIARKALEAGKHVLVEKPMATSSSECYELVNLAKTYGLVLNVGHIYRFNSALRTARSMLNDNYLGQVFYVRIQWTDQAYFKDRDIIFDLGPHPIDILNQLLNSWPVEVEGVARSYRSKFDHHEVAYVSAGFRDNIFAHIELSWLHPNKVREVIVVGSNGSLTIDCLNQTIEHRNSDVTVNIPVVASNTISEEIEYFIDAIIRNDSSSESGLIGTRTVEALEKIRASVLQHPAVPMLDPLEAPKGNSENETGRLIEAQAEIQALHPKQIGNVDPGVSG